MKLSIILFVIFVSLDAVTATSFTRLLGSALAVQKKVRKDAAKANNAHTKTKKIKVASVQSLKDAGKSNLAESAVDLGKTLGEHKESKSVKVAQKQDAFIGGEDMFLTIAQMMLSRFIMKVNYKDPTALVYSRAAFVAYLALFQVLIWLLKYLVNKRDDHTVLAVNPSSGIDTLLGTIGRLSGQSAMTNTLLSLSKLTSGAQTKTLTAKDHDLEQVQKLSSKLYFDLAMTSIFHYLFGFQSLVLLTPMRGVASLLKNPLVLLHVFRMKSIGKLSRPFKTPLEEIMGSLAKPKVPASPHVHVESAETRKPSAKSKTPSAESIATGIDSEPVRAATTAIVTETVSTGENDVDEEIENEGEVDIQKEAIVVTETQQGANTLKNQVKDSAEMNMAQPKGDDKENTIATSEDELEDEEEGEAGEENEQEHEHEGEGDGEVDEKDTEGDEEDATEENDDIDDADQQEEGDDGEVDEENDDGDDTAAADEEDGDIDEDDEGEDDATDVEQDENVEDDVEVDGDEAEKENTEEEEEGSDNDTEEEANAELLKAIDRFGK